MRLFPRCRVLDVCVYVFIPIMLRKVNEAFDLYKFNNLLISSIHCEIFGDKFCYLQKLLEIVNLPVAGFWAELK